MFATHGVLVYRCTVDDSAGVTQGGIYLVYGDVKGQVT